MITLSHCSLSGIINWTVPNRISVENQIYKVKNYEGLGWKVVANLLEAQYHDIKESTTHILKSVRRIFRYLISKTVFLIRIGFGKICLLCLRFEQRLSCKIGPSKCDCQGRHHEQWWSNNFKLTTKAARAKWEIQYCPSPIEDPQESVQKVSQWSSHPKIAPRLMGLCPPQHCPSLSWIHDVATPSSSEWSPFGGNSGGHGLRLDGWNFGLHSVIRIWSGRFC